MTNTMSLPCHLEDLVGLIPRQQTRRPNSPNDDESSSRATPAPGEPRTPPEARARVGWHLSPRVVDLVAVALLIWVSTLGAELSVLPTPPPSSQAGPGVFRVQSIPVTHRASLRPGRKGMTGWLACPPGSLEPFPALVLLPGPPPPTGCHRP